MTGVQTCALPICFTEAQAADDSLFGDDRLLDFVTGLTLDEPAPLKRLVADIRAFENGMPAADDMAAMLVSIGA